MSDPLDEVEPEPIFGTLTDPDAALDPEPMAPGSTPDKFRVKRTELLEAIDDRELAYMSPGDLPSGATFHKSGNAEAVSYVGLDERLHICFRGTEKFTTVEGLRDFMTDVSGKLLNMNIGLGLPESRPRGEQGIVHQGFSDYVNELYGELSGVISESGRPFVLTGHSLGGAAACVFALKYFQDTTERPYRVYLVGAPKAFELFGTLFDEYIECVNIMNEDDPVTYVPPAFATHKGYKLVMLSVGGYDALSRAEQLSDIPKDPLQQFEMMREKQQPGFMGAGELAEYDAAIRNTIAGGLSNYSSTLAQLFSTLTMDTLRYSLAKGSVASHALLEYRSRISQLPDVVEWSTEDPIAKSWHEIVYASTDGNGFMDLISQWDQAMRRDGPMDIPRMTVEPSVAKSSLSSAPVPGASTPGSSVAGLSGQMLSAISSQMKIGGFIFYPEDEKNEHEFNLIYYE